MRLQNITTVSTSTILQPRHHNQEAVLVRWLHTSDQQYLGPVPGQPLASSRAEHDLASHCGGLHRVPAAGGLDPKDNLGQANEKLQNIKSERNSVLVTRGAAIRIYC